MRVIDGASNKQLGVMDTREAVKLAKQQGLDLVQIAAKVNPPVCKIIDYGKYKYDLAKQKKDSPKAKGGKTKEVKFRVGIEEHDYNLKLRRAEQFLGENNKLRVQLMFRGRQMAHKEIGFEIMQRVTEDLEGMANVDFPPRLSGRFITMQLSPLPANQQVRKFSQPEDEDLGEDGDESDDPGDGKESESRGEEE